MRFQLESRSKRGVQVNCKCMELVATGWWTGKCLRLDRSIRGLTCDDLEFPLVVIRLGVT